MDISAHYQNEIDLFCEKNNTDSYEAIMEKQRSYVRANDASCINDEGKYDIRKKRFTYLHRMAAVWLLCILLGGITTLAATNYEVLKKFFQESLKDIFHDHVSAELIEEGFLYVGDEILTKDQYAAKVVAITGDMSNPIIMMDIAIDDDDFVKDRREILVSVYPGIGVDEFENQRIESDSITTNSSNIGKYAYNTCIGKQDKENSNIYHVRVEGSPAWMCQGKPFIVSLRSIYFTNSDNSFGEKMLNLNFEITVPMENYADIIEFNYGINESKIDDSISFSHEGIIYSLYEASFGKYYSSFNFAVKATEEWIADSVNINELYKLWNEELDEVAERISLKVDDECFEVNDSVVFVDTQNVNGYEGYIYGSLYFPAIDFGVAKRVALVFDDKEITFK